MKLSARRSMKNLREGNTITRTDEMDAFQLAWISPHTWRPRVSQSRPDENWDWRKVFK